MEWKNIIGFQGIYQVSEKGDIKKLRNEMPMPNGGVRIDKEKILIASLNHKGYLQISLSKNNKKHPTTIHRIVATHFLETIPEKYHVNHKDCNKTNNHYSNLEWCTNHENILHAVKNKRYKGNKISTSILREYSKNATGSKNCNATKFIDNHTGVVYGSIVEYCKLFSVSRSTMYKRISKGIKFKRL